uniref:Uncharacterized protein n=1 Tax=Hucho hucho TaxID=62062 RepID=A0A4W5PQ74_9TELE
KSKGELIRSGAKHGNVDALSRRETYIALTTTPSPTGLSALPQRSQHSPEPRRR